MKRHLLASACWLLATGICFSQKTFTLEIKSVQPSAILEKLPYKRSFSSATDRDKELNNLLLSLYDNAYLSASIDSSKNDSLHRVAYLRTRDPYKWATLRKGNVDEATLSEAGFREKIFYGTPLSYKQTAKLQERILQHCENNGYPFASVQLDSIVISGTSFSAALNLQRNILVRIDSVVNRGDAKISDAYLQSYLGIRNGSLYNEAALKKATMRIKELPFVREKIPFRVLFPGEKAIVEFYLEKRRASRFDGILGLLPDSKTGKVLLTGDVNLKLHNSFNRGELLELRWRRLHAATQDLRSRLVLPYLFRTPFGADASFKLFKKDSTYLEVNPGLGIQYHFTGEDHLKVFVNRREFTLISTKGLENLTTLPPYADITSSLYGMSVQFQELDYKLNPRRGIALSATAAAGNKNIHKNEKLNPVIYDGLKLSSVQYSAELDADVFIPIKNKSTVRIGSRSAWVHNENLFLNELFRLGGLKSLRGFDEESIFASSFSMLTLEYRYLLEENSYLFLFAEGAYYENRSISFSGDRHDTPYGFGTGISFETRAGIFSVNYALGSQLGNPIDVRAGKVHFGLVNYF